MAVTLLQNETETTLPNADASGDDLWLSLPDLTKATGWEIKPEGVCRDTACVALPEDRIESFLRGEGADERFNVAEFARLIEQPIAHNDVNDAWYIGPPAWEWKDRLAGGQAPDFTLPGFEGRPHSLSDYRGKKVFLLAWASW